ncbi:MAG: hypothetical protein V4773_03350 [Verrucomicrobiota bacterium]
MRGGFSHSFATLALLFAVLCAPLVFSNRLVDYAHDETAFHLPAIRQIRSHWPALDLRADSLSAISPGYHYALATASLVTGTERVPLRVFTWAMSLALLYLLWRLFAPAPFALRFAVLLPLCVSNIFVKGASWIITDNAALLFVALSLALVFFVTGPRSGWWAGAAAGIATFFRQLHAWTALPIALRPWLRPDPGASVSHRLLASAGALVPLVVVIVLFSHWGGLVPPAWQTVHAPESPLSFASLIYLLAIFFLFGLAYRYAAPVEDEPGATQSSPWRRIGAVAGLVLVLLGPSTYDYDAGRWGGYLWNLSEYLPAPFGRSVLFLLLAPAGGALVADMTLRLSRASGAPTAALWLAAYLGWACTFLVNRMAFQRYFETTTLLFLLFWTLLIVRSRPTAVPWRHKPLLALGLVQLSITLATAHWRTWHAPALPGL